MILYFCSPLVAIVFIMMDSLIQDVVGVATGFLNGKEKRQLSRTCIEMKATVKLFEDPYEILTHDMNNEVEEMKKHTKVGKSVSDIDGLDGLYGFMAIDKIAHVNCNMVRLAFHHMIRVLHLKSVYLKRFGNSADIADTWFVTFDNVFSVIHEKNFFYKISPCDFKHLPSDFVKDWLSDRQMIPRHMFKGHASRFLSRVARAYVPRNVYLYI